jgi:hypothetical protein
MPTVKPTFVTHMSGPKANALADALNGAHSPERLTAAMFPYPVATAISKMMAAGVGNVEALRGMGFSSSDAISTAAAITAAGARAKS